jgi:hypothetical protein
MLWGSALDFVKPKGNLESYLIEMRQRISLVDLHQIFCDYELLQTVVYERCHTLSFVIRQAGNYTLPVDNIPNLAHLPLALESLNRYLDTHNPIQHLFRKFLRRI